jgi:hypothetical protein
MASYNNVPSGMSTLPVTVNNTVASNGFNNGLQQSGKNKIVRVTAVNEQDGSIFYDTLSDNTGRSYLGSPQPMRAKMLNNTLSSPPFVGELVEITSAPSIGLANDKGQAIYETYYRPVSVDVWQNQNNNIILDNTVAGQLNDTKMASINTDNYINSLNGFT